MPAGRPKLKEGLAQTALIQTRVTPGELTRFRAAARRHGLTLSEWVRAKLTACIEHPEDFKIAQQSVKPLPEPLAAQLPEIPRRAMASLERPPVTTTVRPNVLATTFSGAISAFTRGPSSRN